MKRKCSLYLLFSAGRYLITNIIDMKANFISGVLIFARSVPTTRSNFKNPYSEAVQNNGSSGKDDRLQHGNYHENITGIKIKVCDCMMANLCTTGIAFGYVKTKIISLMNLISLRLEIKLLYLLLMQMRQTCLENTLIPYTFSYFNRCKINYTNNLGTFIDNTFTNFIAQKKRPLYITNKLSWPFIY
ncbi:hypothetical protein BD770DRAFT_416106 [Pilaira anomala]|nr:hypothetical protein BD770DRAFT_416106 [Pilaira anomala]